MTKPLGILLAMVLLGLAGCGGGGDDGPSPNVGIPAGSGSTCPRAHVSDVWLNNRLACLTAGQRVIDMAGGGSGEKVDMAFVIRQVAYNSSVTNLLPGNEARHFKHFLCVRSAPANLNRQLLAADLEVVMGIFSGGLPSGVGASALSNAGTTQSGYAAMPCDPAVHPVIVNYDSGIVESINPAAMASLEVYDV